QVLRSGCCNPIASCSSCLLRPLCLRRNQSIVIVGFSLFIGLSVPQYFNEYLVLSRHGTVHTDSTSFSNIVQVIFSSPTTVAIIVAYLLDSTMSLEICTYLLCKIDKSGCLSGKSVDNEVEEEILLGHPDYVLDRIDNIDTKVALLAPCVRRGLKVISATGAGARADLTRIHIADLRESTNDPLSRSIDTVLNGISKSVYVQ
ncbi:hypothetical protein RYX36_003586, partial [Vicia faba]